MSCITFKCQNSSSLGLFQFELSFSTLFPKNPCQSILQKDRTVPHLHSLPCLCHGVTMPMKNEPWWGGQCWATHLPSPLIFPHLGEPWYLSPSRSFPPFIFFLPLPYSRCLARGLRFPPQPQSLPTLPQGPKCSRIRDVEIMWLEYFHPASRKSGSADCLFEGKEASAKHPVLKSLPGFCSAVAAQLPLWRQGEAEECWREVQQPLS